MAKRYVWEQYILEVSSSRESTSSQLATGKTDTDPSKEPMAVGWISDEYKFNDDHTGFTSGGTRSTVRTDTVIQADDMRYFFPLFGTNANPFVLEAPSGGFWHGSYWGNTTGTSERYQTGVRLLSSGDVNSTSAPCNKITIAKTKGKYVGVYTRRSKKNLSGENLPDDGYVEPYGKYWFIYQGYDVIEPQSIVYSPEKDFKAGDTVTLTVYPSTEIRFGGNLIYYIYYSVDDYAIGSADKKWISALATLATDALLVDITIPEDAEWFCAHVIVTDTWGYKSEEPIYGQMVNVKRDADITPKRVYYSSDAPKKIGEKFTVYVEPPDDYTGVLFYQYQYRISESLYDWGNIGSETSAVVTTSTEKETALDPYFDKDAVLFQARVRSGTVKSGQSSLDTVNGIVSDWIEGPVLEVTKGLNAYIGINDQAKSVIKMYIGTGTENTASEIVSGYVGISNQAKKWG